MSKLTYTIEYGNGMFPETEIYDNFVVASSRAKNLAKTHNDVFVSRLRKEDGQRIFYNRDAGASITGKPW